MLRRSLLGALGAASVALLGTAAFSAAATAAPAAAWPDSTEPAGTWAPGPSFPLKGNGVEALSCGTPSFCGAVDQDGDAWTFSKGAWSYYAQIGEDSSFVALQCFSNQTCVGADDEGHLVTYRNGSWIVSSEVYTEANNGWSSMSCAGPDLCIFVSETAQLYMWNGATLSSPKVPDERLTKAASSGAGGAAYVVCAAGTTSCVMVDSSGNVATYKAGVWSGLTRLPSFLSYSSLLGKPACVSATDCIVPFDISQTDRNGAKWAVYNGKDWALVSSGTAGYPYADSGLGSTMSCVAGFCMGLDTVGAVPLRGFTFNGKAWAVTGFFGDNTAEPNLLSCTSPKWCMAVDTRGTGPSWIFHPRAA